MNEGDIIYVEKYEMKKIIEILKSDYFIKIIGSKNEKDWGVNDFNIILEMYNHNGEISRRYETRDTNKNGRLYTNSGFQYLNKYLRSYICSERYYDLDISSCAASILNQLMVSELYNSSLLNEYIHNKNEWRDQFKNIKNLINHQIYDKNNLRYHSDEKANRLLKSIHEFVKDKNDMFSIITTIERKILDKIINICNNEGYRINTLMFDGLIVEKNNNNINTLIDKINISIFPYKIENKPWLVPEIKIYDLRKFDYNENITFQDYVNSINMILPSHTHALMFSLPYIIKTVRVINNNFIVKKKRDKICESYDVIKDNEKFVTYLIYYNNGKRKKIYINEIINFFRRIISFDKLTSKQYNIQENEFSIDPGFLCDNIILPNDWEERVIPFRRHIFEVYANKNEKLEKLFYYWFSNLIQTDNKSQIMMVIFGNEGSGKSLIPTFLSQKILGSKSLIISTLEEMCSNKFNSFLSGKRLILINELSNIDSNTKYHDNNILKNIIDAPYLVLEKKGKDKINIENTIEIFACSNYANCISQCDGMGRRNIINKSSNKYIGDKKYFYDLLNYFEDEKNIKSIFHFLNTYDISDRYYMYNIQNSENKNIGVYKSFSNVKKGILLYCSDFIFENGEVKHKILDVKLSELYNNFIYHKLINTMEFKKTKLLESIIMNFGDEIKITKHSRIVNLKINTSLFHIGNDLWKLIKEFSVNYDDD